MICPNCHGNGCIRKRARIKGRTPADEGIKAAIMDDIISCPICNSEGELWKKRKNKKK